MADVEFAVMDMEYAYYGCIINCIDCIEGMHSFSAYLSAAASRGLFRHQI